MGQSALKILFLLFVSVINSNYLSAQSFLLQELPKEKTQINFHFMRPTIENNADLSVLSGVYEFSVNAPLSEKLNLIGAIPFLNFKSGDRDAESGVGNIFLGLQIHKGLEDNKGSVVTLGLSLPTADEDVGLFGLFTDFNGFHKYSPNTLTIYTNYAYHAILNESIKLGVEVGPNIMIPTKGEAETEIFMHYGLTAGFQVENFAIFTELLGLAILTEEADNFSDRFTHSIDFGAMYIGSRISSGLYYKLYLDEMLSEIINGTLGIKLTVSLN